MIVKQVHGFLRLLYDLGHGFMLRFYRMNATQQPVSIVTSIKVTKVTVPFPVFQDWGGRTRIVGWYVEKKAA